MRDGVQLAADIYRPDTEAPVSTLLCRTPYGRSVALTYPRQLYDGLRFVKEGYAIVTQDTRGRFESEGDFYPFRNEAADGSDTIAWITRQAWSDGRIGMIGGSYVGATQWLPASENPPGLLAIAPAVTASDYRDGWLYRGGAFELGFSLDWTLGLCLDTARRIAEASGVGGLVDRVLDARDRLETLYRGLDPDAASLLEEVAPYYFEWLAHPDRDAAWPSIAPDPDPEAARAPALNIGGWYDNFVEGTLVNYTRQRSAAMVAGRPAPRLIVGPWTHDIYTGIFRGRRFGSRSSIDSADLVGEEIRWFDRWVRGVANDVESLPPVRLFVMGADEWRDFNDWPPPAASERRLYLRPPKFDRRGRRHAGRLTATPPSEDGPGVELRFDPTNPVPTLGGATLLAGSHIGELAGPVDLGSIATRADVIRYTSRPFVRPTLIVGSIELHLVATATSGRGQTGFDLAAHVSVVSQDGHSEVLTSGIIRVPPGRAGDRLQMSLGATAVLIDRGQRLSLIIATSDFPRFDLNPSAMASEGTTVSITASGGNAATLILQVMPDHDAEEAA